MRPLLKIHEDVVLIRMQASLSSFYDYAAERTKKERKLFNQFIRSQKSAFSEIFAINHENLFEDPRNWISRR